MLNAHLGDGFDVLSEIYQSKLDFEVFLYISDVLQCYGTIREAYFNLFLSLMQVF